MTIFCSVFDGPALWVYGALRERRVPVTLVTAEELCLGLRWVHRVSDGGADVEVGLGDGRVLRGAELGGVLNRLVTLPLAHHAPVRSEDREYAQSEVYAFFLSWLASLPGPVWNPPSACGLGGRWLHACEWALRAGRAGLDTHPYVQASDATATGGDATVPAERLPRDCVSVVVSGSDVLAAVELPRHVEAACRALADAAMMPLLGITLQARSWRFVAATPWPDLRAAGPAVLEALTQGLGGAP